MHSSVEPSISALTTLESVLSMQEGGENAKTAVEVLRRVLQTWRGPMDAACLTALTKVISPGLLEGLKEAETRVSQDEYPEERWKLTMYRQTCEGIAAMNGLVAQLHAQIDPLLEEVQNLCGRLEADLAILRAQAAESNAP